MKKLRIILPVVLLAMALGFTACKKDKADPGGSNSANSTLGIQIQAMNKTFSLPVNTSGLKSAAITSASITWDTASMVISHIKYEAELNSLITHRDSIKISYEWSGPQDVNLFDTNITLGNFVLQPGYYDEIEVKVDGFKQDAGSGPVFYLHGIYTKDDNTTLPVIVSVNENVMFKTEKDSVAISSADNTVFTSIIQLYLDQLMADIQLSALDSATLTNGAIVISADSNRELYRIIMRNLHKDHHCEHGHHHGHGNGHGNGHDN
jgi:hypothetical protein